MGTSSLPVKKRQAEKPTLSSPGRCGNKTGEEGVVRGGTWPEWPLGQSWHPLSPVVPQGHGWDSGMEGGYAERKGLLRGGPMTRGKVTLQQRWI